MNLIVKLTDRCNNNCSYCYENLNKCGDMPITTLKYLISTLPLNEHIHITYHGGEPLLLGIGYFKTIQAIIAKSNLKITQSIQTNGLLLTTEFINHFNNCNINCSISTDLSSERESELTLTRLSSLIANGLELNILSVIHKNNIAKLIKLYSDLKSIGTSNICFSNIYNCDELRPAQEDFLHYYHAFYRYLLTTEDIRERTFLDNYLKYTGSESTLTCTPEHCRYNFLTVYPDGSLYPCDRGSSKNYYVGDIHSYTDIRQVFESEVYSNYYTDSVNLQLNHCKDCELANFCRSGCLCSHNIADGLLNIQECDNSKHYYSILSNILKGGTYEERTSYNNV